MVINNNNSQSKPISTLDNISSEWGVSSVNVAKDSSLHSDYFESVNMMSSTVTRVSRISVQILMMELSWYESARIMGFNLITDDKVDLSFTGGLKESSSFNIRSGFSSHDCLLIGYTKESDELSRDIRPILEALKSISNQLEGVSLSIDEQQNTIREEYYESVLFDRDERVVVTSYSRLDDSNMEECVDLEMSMVSMPSVSNSEPIRLDHRECGSLNSRSKSTAKARSVFDQMEGTLEHLDDTFDNLSKCDNVIPDNERGESLGRSSILKHEIDSAVTQRIQERSSMSPRLLKRELTRALEMTKIIKKGIEKGTRSSVTCAPIIRHFPSIENNLIERGFMQKIEYDGTKPKEGEAINDRRVVEIRVEAVKVRAGINNRWSRVEEYEAFNSFEILRRKESSVWGKKEVREAIVLKSVGSLQITDEESRSLKNWRDITYKTRKFKALGMIQRVFVSVYYRKIFRNQEKRSLLASEGKSSEATIRRAA